MSPKEILRLAGNRLAKSPKVDEVGTMRPFRSPGALDGIGEGWACIVTDKTGATFEVRVTLYSFIGD